MLRLIGEARPFYRDQPCTTFLHQTNYPLKVARNPTISTCLRDLPVGCCDARSQPRGERKPVVQSHGQSLCRADAGVGLGKSGIQCRWQQRGSNHGSALRQRLPTWSARPPRATAHGERSTPASESGLEPEARHERAARVGYPDGGKPYWCDEKAAGTQRAPAAVASDFASLAEGWAKVRTARGDCRAEK